MSQVAEVRVRIAPSPTGDPHVGTAYIALFNSVFAKKHGGKFVLRIEDTDRTRSRSSSEAQILTYLRWLGLQWDEGPDIGGPYGPYRQSERQDHYAEHAKLLLQKGHAYKCFCSAERLAELRERQRQAGERPGYDGHCRDLEPSAVQAAEADGRPFVVRLKMPRSGQTVFRDELRGEIAIDNAQLDDQVLLKSDGFPTYHLANVVDDHLMRISHVIRAEEWISSTPKHVQLYRAFGWPEPTFVHMPLLRNSDKSKISKRKNPVSLAYYKRAGILPTALVNFLGLMGWSFGEDREIFSVAEMTERFDFGNIHLGGPVFDQVKLAWLNHQYLQRMSEDEFVSYIREELFSDEVLRKLKPLAQERMTKFDQFVDNNAFFFNGALSYAGLEVVPAKADPSAFKKSMRALIEELDELYDWNAKTIEGCLNAFKEKHGLKPKDFFMPLRLITTGRKDSPPLAESLEIIGRDMVRFRIRDFLEQ